jgi:predicted alpha/beta superfamily hydrolase
VAPDSPPALTPNSIPGPIEQDLISPAILVAMAPSYGNRGYEYTLLSSATIRPDPDRNPAPDAAPMPNPNRFGGGGGIESYYDFLAHQVKPFIDSHFRTLADPAHTGVAGSSLGGLARVYLGYHHPETVMSYIVCK